jgi:hypothetical protein
MLGSGCKRRSTERAAILSAAARLPPTCNYNACSRLCEEYGCVAANPRGAAGYQRNLAFQISCHCFFTTERNRKV